MEMTKPMAVGIDLGTTNSAVAILKNGRPVVLPNAEGSSFTPSLVGFTPSGELRVGALARGLALTEPERVSFAVKRHMGTDWTFQVDDRAWRPEEISARILQKLMRDAETAVGEPVTQAVITVPAYFDDTARQATLDAARIAGLDVLRLVNEPTAAALAYGLGTDGASTVLVFDLGGGTCDVSVLAIAGGVFEVRSTCGNASLGGNDWDERLAAWMLDQAAGTEAAWLHADPVQRRRLLDLAETAKIELSAGELTTVSVPMSGESSMGSTDVMVTRAAFEAQTADLLDACRSLFLRAVADAGITVAALDHIVLVGGATRMPAIRRLLQELTGRAPHAGIDPERVVAVGAALQAGVLLGERTGLLLIDVTPLSLGIETYGGVMTRLIERNTTIPTRHSQVFTTAEDAQSMVEVHVLQGERPTAAQNLSLGILQLSGIMKMARGEPQIEVVFTIDADGIVHVAARDLLTGAEEELTMTGNSALGADDINEMILEAELYADEDRQHRDDTGARNEAELALYHTERLLMDDGERIGEWAEALKDTARDLTFALERTDVEAVRLAHKALLDALQAGAADERGSREG
jgi:molecular chaperone DnaK